MSDERKELIARLRAVKNDWETTQCYNGTRLEAADLLERDGAEIARWQQVWDNVQLDVPDLRDDNKPLAVACSYELTKRERDAARAEAEALRKDAERIDWLQHHATAARWGRGNAVVWECKEIRAAIDAAKERT